MPAQTHLKHTTTSFSRAEQLAQLSDSSIVWDLLVIGGGASGLGVALDAVSRGYKTLLVEGSDFAKGTSSRSTKLVHGGVRYLAQGDVKLVREASVERGRLCRNAPHLVKNQPFVIPVYSQWERVKFTAGLKLYDWIAGTLSLGSSVFLSREKTIEALPGVKTDDLVGGVQYRDGQFDDARLAINLVQTIEEAGGCAVNYCKVAALLKDADGEINGAEVTDVETDTTYVVRAKAVVNATGVFVDDVLNMDDKKAKRTVCVSQGVHVVVDRSFFPSATALMIPATSDGRVLFAVPWHNRVVLGTTDTPVDKATLEPEALEKEIDFILDTAGDYLLRKPTRADVCSVFAGLRPLAVPTEEGQKTKEISRNHKILVSPSGLFTVVGGKWTTFRKMGEDVVTKVEVSLGWKSRRSTSAALRIHGAAQVDWDDPFYVYGADAADVKKLMATGGKWISKRLKIHEAQVRWAVTHEMARTVEDVLSRRTRVLLLDAVESIRICEEVAAVMAEELGRDKAWAEMQVQTFTQLASRYCLRNGSLAQLSTR